MSYSYFWFWSLAGAFCAIVLVFALEAVFSALSATLALPLNGWKRLHLDAAFIRPLRLALALIVVMAGLSLLLRREVDSSLVAAVFGWLVGSTIAVVVELCFSPRLAKMVDYIWDGRTTARAIFEGLDGEELGAPLRDRDICRARQMTGKWFIVSAQRKTYLPIN